ENENQPTMPATPSDANEMQALLATPETGGPMSSPSPLVALSAGGESVEFWPYTGTNFSGTPQDPINLIFFGHADPREIRAALMSLNGDRTAMGMPDEPPFNQTWTDAIGDVQTGYGNPRGWTGGAIQLACGDYAPLRFHVRLFRVGDCTIANAHLDLHIPGTADHQVISWERAEEFVMADLMRSGLLDPATPLPTEIINQPDFRTIPAILYNEIPVSLRGYIGGPLENVDTDVPIGSDGRAQIFKLAGVVASQPGVQVEAIPIVFGQVVPRPFCSSGPGDYLYVSGTVNLVQTNELTPAGHFRMEFDAEGELTVIAVDPLTGEPVGDPFTATVREHHSSALSDRNCDAASWLYQRLSSGEGGDSSSLFRRLHIREGRFGAFTERERCD
ncbi:MAG: hypothetical protein V1774_05100, partial [Candidatus Eisenbacteria bacterium]